MFNARQFVGWMHDINRVIEKFSMKYVVFCHNWLVLAG